MTTILADSFTAALAKLANDEQKQAKLTAFDLQTDPQRPGLSLHRIEASKDPNFWSVRASRDLRIIIHKSGNSILLAYVGHHDDAYQWAERRRIEAHPRTGALQIVEVRERTEVAAGESPVSPGYPPAVPQEAQSATEPLFASLGVEDFLSVGVPEDWVADVQVADEDGFFALAHHLPQEAAEALLTYAATGTLPLPPRQDADALLHPDATRRFRVLEGHEELQAALDQPFEKWAVFLHPSQRHLVDRDYSGPVRIAGSAGTGKTVVALHRVAKVLRKDAEARILLTTFSDPLAEALKRKLKVLLSAEPTLIDRVTISSFERAARDLFALAEGREPHLIRRSRLREMIAGAAAQHDAMRFSSQFLNSEFEHVIDANQVDSAEAYAAVQRMGRKSRLGARQREALWSIFANVWNQITASGFKTPAGLFSDVATTYAERQRKPYSHIIVDEAQDLGVCELKFLRAIASDRADALFFAGDLGQRIFQQPFSWKALGIDVRGRSFTLHVNYRTSHQIRQAADALLPESMRDVDGDQYERKGTVSLFDGPPPVIAIVSDAKAETDRAAQFIGECLAGGLKPSEIAIFCRSNAEMPRVAAIAAAAGVETVSAADELGKGDALLISTMHLAKGLEFRAVSVVACDEDVLPLAARVDDVADEFELDEVIATEKQLLYVAATRARERLFVSAVTPGSEFLEELAERHCFRA